MEKEITLEQVSELLKFGERAERELNRLFGTPASTTRPTKPRPARCLFLRSSRLGHKLAKN